MDFFCQDVNISAGSTAGGGGDWSGSSLAWVPAPCSCGNFTYTFELNLPTRKVRKSSIKFAAGGGDKCEKKKRIDE